MALITERLPEPMLSRDILCPSELLVMIHSWEHRVLLPRNFILSSSAPRSVLIGLGHGFIFVFYNKVEILYFLYSGKIRHPS